MQTQTSDGEDESFTKCARQPAGYSFSLAKFVPGLVTGDDFSVPTKPQLIPLAFTIAFSAFSVLAYTGAILVMMRRHRISVTNEHLPLKVMRAGYLSNVAATICAPIWAAKITAVASRVSGTKQTQTGMLVKVYMGNAFYGVAWTSVAVLWLALALSGVVAFRIAKFMEQDPDRHARHERHEQITGKK